MADERKSDDRFQKQLDELLESLEKLLESPETQPNMQLLVATDILQRAGRRLAALPDRKKRIAFALSLIYRKRKDGIPMMVLPDRIDEEIRNLLSLCEQA